MDSRLFIDDSCFACGKKNSSGLKLDIQRQEEKVNHCFRKVAAAEITFFKEFQGYGGVVHGGILSTVLDELMIYALFFEDIPTVTAKMEITFKKKVKVGEMMKGRGWIVKVREKTALAESELLNSQNQIVAVGRGIYVKVNDVVKLS
jgi:uncharacterized protein (TIGR00369 family)